MEGAGTVDRRVVGGVERAAVVDQEDVACAPPVTVWRDGLGGAVMDAIDEVPGIGSGER